MLERTRYVLSCLRHPVLRPLAKESGVGQAVYDLAKRIRLTNWLDSSQNPREHSLSFIQFPRWQKDSVKLAVAETLLESGYTAPAGKLSVIIYGPEAPVYSKEAYDKITGFEIGGVEYEFYAPLLFRRGIGI
jgi:hypothetical protein